MPPVRRIALIRLFAPTTRNSGPDPHVSPMTNTPQTIPLRSWFGPSSFGPLSPRRAVLLAALGIATSLTIAAVCTLWGDSYPDTYEAARSAKGDWYIRGWAVRPGRYERIVQWASFTKMEEGNASARLGTGGWGHSDSYPLRRVPLDTNELPERGSSRHAILAGAPFPCLTGWHDETGGCEVMTTDSRGIICPRYRMSMPILPVWSGLAADTVTFAALWQAGLRALRGQRTANRERKGLCTHCAYDLRATPTGLPCPECGRAGS